MYHWLEENLDAFEAKIPAFYHARLPQLVDGSCLPDNLLLLQEFFGARGEPYAESLERAVEAEEFCIDRRERYADDLQKFLAPYSR